MSLRAIEWALRTRTGDGTRKAVLLVLADVADGGGRCWPSQAYIAERAEISVRSVRRHLAALEAAGLIRRTPRGRRDGGRGTDFYTLALERPPDLANPPDKLAANPSDNLSRKGVDTGQTDRPPPDARVRSPRTPASGEPLEDPSRRTPNHSAPPEPEASPSWTAAAGDAWREALGGTPPVSRINRALRPLVDEHGREEVLATWAGYLEAVEPRFASPENFASRFGVIRDGTFFSRNGDGSAGPEDDPYAQIVQDYNAQIAAEMGRR